MRAGAYQVDAAVREASCSEPVNRWCRCANWRANGAWGPELEEYNAGDVEKKDAQGATVYV